jgi:hypothetical protein
MKKIETIWHYLLWEALEKGQYKHTQKDLAGDFGYSLSTINLALKKPTQIGAIRKTSRFFVLNDFKKLLYYWATNRNLAKDVVYQTFFSGSVTEAEGLVPPEAIYAGYTAGKKILGEAAADYAKLYFYIDSSKLIEVKKRFPKQKVGETEIFVLKLGPGKKINSKITTLPQTFVDIWNMADWYAKDFIKNLEEKIDGLLS